MARASVTPGKATERQTDRLEIVAMIKKKKKKKKIPLKTSYPSMNRVIELSYDTKTQHTVTPVVKV